MMKRSRTTEVSAEMTEFARLKPGEPVPPLLVDTVGGPCWRLCDQKPKNFTLVLFYRGLHCSFCREQLKETEARYDAFLKRGVRVLAVSADSRERAERAADEWGIDQLTLCYGLTLDQAKAWGLYVSAGRGTSPFTGLDEPAFFVEPAMFLVRPNGTLFGGEVQTMPFARPHLDDVLRGVDYILAHGFAPRGDYEARDPRRPRPPPSEPRRPEPSPIELNDPIAQRMLQFSESGAISDRPDDSAKSGSTLA